MTLYPPPVSIANFILRLLRPRSCFSYFPLSHIGKHFFLSYNAEPTHYHFPAEILQPIRDKITRNQRPGDMGFFLFLLFFAWLPPLCVKVYTLITLPSIWILPFPLGLALYVPFATTAVRHYPGLPQACECRKHRSLRLMWDGVTVAPGTWCRSSCWIQCFSRDRWNIRTTSLFPWFIQLELIGLHLQPPLLSKVVSFPLLHRLQINTLSESSGKEAT